jgi:hypothetical protein
MLKDKQLIEEIYYFLQKVSRGITSNKETQHELVQEVTLQVLKKDFDVIEGLKERGELDAWLCSIMYRNYSSNNSPFNYHERKLKDLVPYSIDLEWVEVEDKKQPPKKIGRDEYNEQQRVLNYMQLCIHFTPLDVNIMIQYFGTQYNFKETHEELVEAGVDVSYGWMYSRLKEIKAKIPNEFKVRWTS